MRALVKNSIGGMESKSVPYIDVPSKKALDPINLEL